MHLKLLALLAAPAYAFHNGTEYWENDIYNASGAVTFSGFDISSPITLSTPWTAAQHLIDSNEDDLIWRDFAFKQDKRVNPSTNSTKGWRICHYVMPGVSSRSSTSPVDSTCKGIISDECITALKNTPSSQDDICQFPSAKACGENDGMYTFGVSENSTLTKNGWWRSGGFSTAKGNRTEDYDKQLRDVSVMWTTFSREIKNGYSTFHSNVTCVGFDSVKPGSRTLEQAVSGAASMHVSLLVVVAALMLAL